MAAKGEEKKKNNEESGSPGFASTPSAVFGLA
jgi:hypothetical protein